MGTNQRKHRVLVKQAISLVVLVVAAVLLGQWYFDSVAEARFVKVRFENGQTFRLEVVNTPAERAKGLMFRRYNEMQDDQGMLFIFPDESPRTFWMRNTLIPLDMLFIGSDARIVGIVANAKPLSEEPRGVDKPSKYVIELLGGSAKKFGIAEGSKVELPTDLPAAN